MGKLYRRIVTMGMISISALLAWIYCILEYRNEPVYLGGMSLILVGSVYMMFIFLVDLKALKEEALQSYITQAVQALRQEEQNVAGNQDTEMERLVKALYVQVRKINSAVADLKETEACVARVNGQSTEELKQVVADTANKLAKVIVKYNQSAKDETMEILAEISKKLSEVNISLENTNSATDSVAVDLGDLPGTLKDIADDMAKSKDRIENVSDELQDVKKKLRKIDGVVQNTWIETHNNADVLAEISGNIAVGGSVETDDEPSYDDNTSFGEEEQLFESTAEQETLEAEKEEILNYADELFGGVGLSQDDLDSLLLDGDKPTGILENFDETNILSEDEKMPEADVIPFPSSNVVEDNDIPDTDIETFEEEEAPDSNRMMTPDEIAALFASMSGSKNDTVDDKEEDNQKEEFPDEEEALVGGLSDDIMPQNELEEGNRDMSTSGDSNRIMTPEEIAALFASVGV